MGEAWPVSSRSDFFLGIINGAPNLKALKGTDFDAEILEVIPEGKYSLLNEFSFYIFTDEEERNCLKLAQARPTLTCFSVAAQSESNRQYLRSFVHVAQTLLSS